MIPYTIGIDPGKDTGFALYDRANKQIKELLTLNFVSTINYMKRFPVDSIFAVVVEVPATKANWHNSSAAHNVGRVCRESELMAAMLVDMGFNVITQHPKGKVDAKRFTLITGWENRNNQHQRDAGMLCFGL